MYMEVPQGNSLNSHLKLAKMLFFAFTKSKNRKAEQVLPREIDNSWRGEEVGKGCRRVNMVQILCTHVCNWKNDTC
jgi:hypothetical protein